MSVWIDLWIAILDFISVLQTVKCFHSNFAMLVHGFARIPIQIIRSILNFQCKFCTISMQLKVQNTNRELQLLKRKSCKVETKGTADKESMKTSYSENSSPQQWTLENESLFKMFFGFPMCNSCSIMELCKHNMCRQQEQINV